MYTNNKHIFDRQLCSLKWLMIFSSYTAGIYINFSVALFKQKFFTLQGA